MSHNQVWTLEVSDDVKVHVGMDPKPISLGDDDPPPRLRLGVEMIHDGLSMDVSVNLDARQAWEIGEYLRNAARAYLDAGGFDQ